MPFLVPTCASTPADSVLAAQGLPERCFVCSPGEHVWRVTRGELGLAPCPTLRWLEAHAENVRAGVTDPQRRAMLFGATYGWDTPAADPRTFTGEAAWRIKWTTGVPSLEVPPPGHPDHERRLDIAMSLIDYRLPFGTLERSSDEYERKRFAEEGWFASVARELAGPSGRQTA